MRQRPRIDDADLWPRHDRGACYAGIVGTSALIGIAGANVARILFGWLQERGNPAGRTSTTMLPFGFGCGADLAPWVAIAVDVIGADTVPGFVHGISDAGSRPPRSTSCRW